MNALCGEILFQDGKPIGICCEPFGTEHTHGDSLDNVKPFPSGTDLPLLTALLAARDLLLEMGSKIRFLDEEYRNCELWTNDEGYVPDERYRLVESTISKVVTLGGAQ